LSSFQEQQLIDPVDERERREWPAPVAAARKAGSCTCLRLVRARHTLVSEGRALQIFSPELTDLQRQVLSLLGVPLQAYRPPG
jgi:hypothetical protein